MSDKPVKFYSKDKAHQDAEKLLKTNMPRIESGAPGSETQSDIVATGSAASLGLKTDTKKPLLKKLFWPSLSAFVIFVAGYEAYHFIAGLLESNWLLGLGASILGGAVIVSGGYGLLKGWRARRRFKKREKQKQQFTQLMKDNSYGQAQALIHEVTQDIADHVHISTLKAQYDRQQQQVHNDQELIHIYSGSVIAGLDKMAIDIVTKHASEAAAMVALSPLAAADMALVAWRSSKMIEQLSKLYGCPQTALGRLEMTKRVFKNMMLAGASELVADAGVELLGKSLTATISAKAAQGIGVGVLIARMGLQTMHLCRPMPFGQENKPRLGQIRKSIYQKVVGLVKSASTGKSEQGIDTTEKKN
ncbi:TIGR01620 family protein [Kangiella sp. HD9-110m-PIT-SAG07]|nr:TIGR01620 family protein [Kangiella sp. HD9-110m-PIT-SAG07]